MYVWGKKIDGKQKFLGYFIDEIEAHKAYDSVATQLHREFKFKH